MRSLLQPDEGIAPQFLGDYLRVASDHAALSALAGTPTADHPDAEKRALARGKPEILLVEMFPHVPAPTTQAQAQQFRAGAALLDGRARGLSLSDAIAAATAATRARAVSVTVTETELAAYARVRRGVSGSSDAEVKRLFCLQ